MKKIYPLLFCALLSLAACNSGGGGGSTVPSGSSGHIDSGDSGSGSDGQGDTIDSAIYLPLDNDNSGNTGVKLLIGAGDVDYYRIDISEEGSYYIETTGLTDTMGRLFHGTGIGLLQDEDLGEGLNFRMYVRLIPGTYYIKVAPGQWTTPSGGPYTLWVTPH